MPTENTSNGFSVAAYDTVADPEDDGTGAETSDFLLHDIGTGDGIVQNGGPSTRNKMRTAPLWGLRTRSRLMHDGQSQSFNSAILRHGGEAALVTSNYQRLSAEQRNQLIAFLKSL